MGEVVNNVWMRGGNGITFRKSESLYFEHDAWIKWMVRNESDWKNGWKVDRNWKFLSTFQPFFQSLSQSFLSSEPFSCSHLVKVAKDVHAVVLSNSPTIKCSEYAFPHHLLSLQYHVPLSRRLFRSGIAFEGDSYWFEASLCKLHYLYYVGRGISSVARCRSCGHQFAKHELRVRTTLLRKLHRSIRPYLKEIERRLAWYWDMYFPVTCCDVTQCK